MDTLINILPTPINSFSWAFGGIVVVLYGIRGWQAWKRSHNAFSKYFALMGLFAGIGLFFYGGVALVGAPSHITLASMLLGFMLVDIGLYIHSLFTSAYIKSLINRRLFQLILIASGAGSIILMALGGHVEQTPTLTQFILPMSAVYLQSIFLALTLFPASFIFFNKARQYDEKRLKIRSLVFSFTHFSLGAIAIAGYLFNQNRDTELSSVVSLLLFIIFGVFVLIITNRKSSNKPQ